MKNQEPKAEVKLWRNAEKALNESDEKLSSRIFTLSAGGLGLSFTVFSLIVDHKDCSLGWPALAIWGTYLLCILLDTFSLAIATRKAEKLEQDTRGKIQRGESMTDQDANETVDQSNLILSRIRNTVFILLIITILSTAVYCYWLFLKG